MKSMKTMKSMNPKKPLETKIPRGLRVASFKDPRKSSTTKKTAMKAKKDSKKSMKKKMPMKTMKAKMMKAKTMKTMRRMQTKTMKAKTMKAKTMKAMKVKGYKLPNDVIWIPLSVKNHTTIRYPISAKMKDHTKELPWPLKLQDNGQGNFDLKNVGSFIGFKQVSLHGNPDKELTSR
jgi:hypothetical protein